MRINRLQARDFLGLDSLTLAEVDPDLTVIVGPNGAGKSSMRHAIDLVISAVRWSAEAESKPARGSLARFAGATRRQASDPSYSVRLGIELCEPRERELVLVWLRLALLTTALRDNAHSVSLDLIESYLLERVTATAVEPLLSGTLAVRYEASPYSRFSVGWEFEHDDQTYTMIFRSQHAPSGIVPGRIDELTEWPTNGPLPSILLFPDSQTKQPNAESTPAFSFEQLLPGPGQHVQLAANPSNTFFETQVYRQAIRALPMAEAVSRPYGLDTVFAEALRSIRLLTDQPREPRHLFAASELLDTDSGVSRGDELPRELLRLKLGDYATRQRLDDIEDRFRAITGAGFHLRVQRVAAPSEQERDETWFAIGIDVISEKTAIPLEFAGAGRWEALRLSTALAAEPGSIVVFDEPARSLHPTQQRAVLSQIQSSPTQSIVITHSPFLVPVAADADLHRIIRLDRRQGKSALHRLHAPRGMHAQGKLRKLLGPGDVRALLFASAVILLEGDTDQGAIEQWLSANQLSKRAPHDEGIALVSVDGDKNFVPFLTYLDAFGIPWAIICDGPALEPTPTNPLLRYVAGGEQTPPPTAQSPDFAILRAYWEAYGVYTLAADFRDEIEQFFSRTDEKVWKEVNAEFGRNKTRAGRAFAERVSEPAGVRIIYSSILSRL